MPAVFNKFQVNEISELFLQGKVGVMPTDTIYGLHCLANDLPARDRIYEIKKRPEKMPFIVLIASTKDLGSWDLIIDDFGEEQMKKFWPGPNTLIFQDKSGETHAFRLPNDEFLIDVLSKTGPLVSTSANIHGQSHALTVDEARERFEDGVDFYVDGGELPGKSSSVYKITDHNVEQLR